MEALRTQKPQQSQSRRLASVSCAGLRLQAFLNIPSISILIGAHLSSLGFAVSLNYLAYTFVKPTILEAVRTLYTFAMGKVLRNSFTFI